MSTAELFATSFTQTIGQITILARACAAYRLAAADPRGSSPAAAPGSTDPTQSWINDFMQDVVAHFLLAERLYSAQEHLFITPLMRVGGSSPGMESRQMQLVPMQLVPMRRVPLRRVPLRRAAAGLAALGLLTGCARPSPEALARDAYHQRADTATQHWAAGYGCMAPATAPAVRRQTAARQAGVAAVLDAVPRVGWDACQVMTLLGEPDRIETQESEGGLAYTWWYQGPPRYGEPAGRAHMVQLTRRAAGDSTGTAAPTAAVASPWRVTYVGW